MLILCGAAVILGGCGQGHKSASTYAVPKAQRCANGDEPEAGLLRRGITPDLRK